MIQGGSNRKEDANEKGQLLLWLVTSQIAAYFCLELWLVTSQIDDFSGLVTVPFAHSFLFEPPCKIVNPFL